ncbi:hypothetical protein [Pseudorhodoplanes sinuspersici]|uniref:Uncharacterized protein n=1 Tax=Pseudorhodoplanes sinuspersici TaxID=1235591 RepID=A0A1W6ZWZ3_9HYPH|nr:hypothetical protein [Pseudorhodoplanes sinuspersici]ARQ01275.1 hypothetical protein CAK95_20875 [Pseudorhodoplanes sinuspersici]RKE72952.1 hypothetical protein DFP91_0825 [Pseudorhodoplanes sinuspersici]
MRTLIVAITALATVSFATSALAQSQRRSVSEMMSEMKAKHGQTFNDCLNLATSRGFRLSGTSSDDDGQDMAVMMFIDGCIMGKQR